MKHLLPAIIIAAIATPEALGLDLFKKGTATVFDYKAWSDTADLTKSIESRTLFYPVTLNDEVSVSGQIDVPGQSAEKIFLGALDFAVMHLDPTDDHEQIGEIDPSQKSFMLRLYSKQGSNNNETTFTRLTLVKAENGKIVFTDTQLDVKYREKGLIPRTLAFEKLNPADNSRHHELIEQFAIINSQYLYDMAASIPDNNNLIVTHWDEILNKEIVKGMNPFEVKLILGLPVTERENGDRMRWVYPKNYVLLFVNGILSRIVE